MKKFKLTNISDKNIQKQLQNNKEVLGNEKNGLSDQKIIAKKTK
jgi:hypothetical protein